MEKIARIIVGYHGCSQEYSDQILLGKIPIREWKRSQNERMVRNGLINAEGKLTRLVGGEAEPEPGARRPDANDNGCVNCDGG